MASVSVTTVSIFFQCKTQMHTLTDCFYFFYSDKFYFDPPFTSVRLVDQTSWSHFLIKSQTGIHLVVFSDTLTVKQIYFTNIAETHIRV